MALRLGLGFNNQDNRSRPSGIVPTNYASLLLWHKADAPDADNTARVDNQIVQIKDYSGKNNVSTQSVAAACVIYGRTYKAKPVFDFQGVQWMSMAAALTALPSGDNTVFVVYASDRAASAGDILISGAASGGKRYQLVQNATGINEASNQVPLAFSTLAITPDTNPHVVGLVRSGSTVRVFTDGVFGGTQSANSFTSMTGNNNTLGSFQGSSGFPDGWMGEVQAYAQALPDPVIVQNCAQLLAYWG